MTKDRPAPKATTTTFLVKSKPQTTPITQTYVTQIFNFVLSVAIHHVLIQGIFLNVIISYFTDCQEGIDLILISNDSTSTRTSIVNNNHKSVILWKILLSPLAPWGLKLIVVTYNVLIMVQLRSWVNYIIQIGATLETLQNIGQVQILPWGIQIDEYTKIIKYRPTASNNCEKERSKIIRQKRKFIPLENVIDVIVSEVILSYKVRNCVMLRVKHSCDDHRNDQHNDKEEKSLSNNNVMWDEITLIPVFSTNLLEMSYIECTQLWKAISDTLSTY